MVTKTKKSPAAEAIRLMIEAGERGVTLDDMRMLDQEAGKVVRRFDEDQGRYRDSGRRVSFDFGRIEAAILGLRDAGYIIRDVFIPGGGRRLVLDGFSTMPQTSLNGPPRPSEADFELPPVERLRVCLERAGRSGTSPDNLIYWEREPREVWGKGLDALVTALGERGYCIQQYAYAGGATIRLVETPDHPMVRGSDIPAPV